MPPLRVRGHVSSRRGNQLLVRDLLLDEAHADGVTRREPLVGDADDEAVLHIRGPSLPLVPGLGARGARALGKSEHEDECCDELLHTCRFLPTRSVRERGDGWPILATRTG